VALPEVLEHRRADGCPAEQARVLAVETRESTLIKYPRKPK
jgi:hypothetical protein